MDAVVDPGFAGALARVGGLAVLNLEGVQTRYDDPAAILARIAAAPDGDVHDLLAEVYATPIREALIARRIDEIHAAGSKAAVAATPGAAGLFPKSPRVSIPSLSLRLPRDNPFLLWPYRFPPFRRSLQQDFKSRSSNHPN